MFQAEKYVIYIKKLKMQFPQASPKYLEFEVS